MLIYKKNLTISISSIGNGKCIIKEYNGMFFNEKKLPQAEKSDVLKGTPDECLREYLNKKGGISC